jgi:hypothetical protein
MSPKPSSLRDVFLVERFKRRTISRPVVRLYRVSRHRLKEVPFSGSGVQPGECMVFAIDPQDIADRTEAELCRAVHAVIKNLRRVRRVKERPSAEALRVHQLKTDEEHPLTYRQIAERFARKWRDCSDPESRERKAKRYVAKVRAWRKRQFDQLSQRQRAILRIARELD